LLANGFFHFLKISHYSFVVETFYFCNTEIICNGKATILNFSNNPIPKKETAAKQRFFTIF